MTGSAPESRPPIRSPASERPARSRGSAGKVCSERQWSESATWYRPAGGCQAVRLRRLTFREPPVRWEFLCVLGWERQNHRGGRVNLLQWSPRIGPVPARPQGLVDGLRACLITRGPAGACAAFRPNGWPRKPRECRNRQEVWRAKDRNSPATLRGAGQLPRGYAGLLLLLR